MKCLITFSLLILATLSAKAQLNNPLSRLRDKAADRVNQRTEEATDKALDKAERKQNAQRTSSSDASIASNNSDAGSLRAYNNYDFVPGERILFEDHFTDDQDGEFPAHWELEKGQGALNKIAGEEALALTDGNYVKVKPRMKTANYLGDAFTLEYDTYFPAGSYGLMVFFNTSKTASDQDAYVSMNGAEVQYYAADDNFQLDGQLPASMREDAFANKWHHVAIACKGKQLKIYVDQYRVLTVPDMHIIPARITLGGSASQEGLLVFKNVRIASGGGMNMLGKKFTESKIVTHGINFDVDKASIRPESMGTLNMIVQVMKENPELKFLVGGHTDNTGAAAHNLSLSQQRAEAVKAQLISIGISAERLSSKGFGDTKPISDNGTIEGKATNRRVEFVKI